MSLTFLPAPNRGKWKPGQSGNPKGAQGDRQLQELCRARTEEAVHTLIVMMRTKSANQLPATLAILDRGWGKPAQKIESEGGDSVHLHLLAALAIQPQQLEQPQQEPQQQRQPLIIDGSIPTE